MFQGNLVGEGMQGWSVDRGTSVFKLFITQERGCLRRDFKYQKIMLFFEEKQTSRFKKGFAQKRKRTTEDYSKHCDLFGLSSCYLYL